MSEVPKGCSVIVYDSNKRVLVQLRDEHAKYNPSVHGLFGGGLKNGEVPFECAERELAEELDLHKKVEYFGINTGGHYVYKCEVPESELDRLASQNPKEGQASVIVTKDTIADLDYAPTHQAVIQYFWDNSVK